MKNNKILISLLIFLAILLLSNICMAKDLDIINEYTITVDPRTNGTLDMTYHLEWEVLDSTSEGPLEWIKVGIPNSNVSNITAISKNIKKISYYQDNGDYIRIDFKQSYEAGSVLNIDFKFNQAYMYTISSEYCNYKFTPGWFSDIYIKQLTIKWNSNNVATYSPNATSSQGYYIWTKKNLLKGSKYTVNLSYPKDVFNLSSDMQVSDATITSGSNNSTTTGMNSMIILLAAISILSFFLSIFSGGGYSYRRGFGYHSHRRWHNNNFGSHRSSCVSSCACACACAGGGRAGCSKKDLYGTNLRTQKLNKILNK